MISWKVEKSLKSIVVLHPRKIDFFELSLEQLFPIIQQLDIPQRLLDLNSRRKGACASIEFTSFLPLLSLSLFQMKDKKWTAPFFPILFSFLFYVDAASRGLRGRSTGLIRRLKNSCPTRIAPSDLLFLLAAIYIPSDLCFLDVTFQFCK